MSEKILVHPDDMPEGGWTEEHVGTSIMVRFPDLGVTLPDKIVAGELCKQIREDFPDGSSELHIFGEAGETFLPLLVLGRVDAILQCGVNNAMNYRVSRRSFESGMEGKE